MKNQKGFTLIELMIVVAIIAILAAIALPAYQDYMKRSKVSEAVAAMGACKTSVAEYYAARNALPADLAASGCSNIASQYVTSVDVAAGVISVTPNVAAIGIPAGNITLTPVVASNNLTGWNCSTTLETRYVPATCR